METSLDEVAKGTKTRLEAIEDFYGVFHPLIQKHKKKNSRGKKGVYLGGNNESGSKKNDENSSEKAFK